VFGCHFIASGLATTGNGAPPAVNVSISNIAIQNVTAQGGAGAGAGGGGLGAFPAMRAAEALPFRPNILWISSEDHGPHMGCYGDKFATTPNLQARFK